MIKLVILLYAAVTVFAGPIHQKEWELEPVLFEDLIEPLAEKDESQIFGYCQPFNRLMYAENVNVKSAFFQIKKRDITFPATHSSERGLITCIKIRDHLRTGKNASFKISSGGVHEDFAIINMRSHRGEPINYTVEIYGH